jgi:hypothetical protein
VILAALATIGAITVFVALVVAFGLLTGSITIRVSRY